MKELGLFGATIPRSSAGSGSRSAPTRWSSRSCAAAGWPVRHPQRAPIAYVIRTFGNDEQRNRFLPVMARGEKRAALGSPRRTPAATRSASAPSP
ncbi:MAG: acyl-CoA dehydrogenase family protein [Steroidobacteraceae bacterium]